MLNGTVQHNSETICSSPVIRPKVPLTEHLHEHIAKETSSAVQDAYLVSEAPLGNLRHVKIITIGAGASGINMAFQVKSHMKNVDLVVYEKNESAGGTWFENKYPGCACDIRE